MRDPKEMNKALKNLAKLMNSGCCYTRLDHYNYSDKELMQKIFYYSGKALQETPDWADDMMALYLLTKEYYIRNSFMEEI